MDQEQAGTPVLAAFTEAQRQQAMARFAVLRSHLNEGVVFQKWRWPYLHCPSKGIAVHKQTKDDVVHLRRF
jgi:hypothetical protein